MEPSTEQKRRPYRMTLATVLRHLDEMSNGAEQWTGMQGSVEPSWVRESDRSLPFVKVMRVAHKAKVHQVIEVHAREALIDLSFWWTRAKSHTEATLCAGYVPRSSPFLS